MPFYMKKNWLLIVASFNLQPEATAPPPLIQPCLLVQVRFLFLNTFILTDLKVLMVVQISNVNIYN
jgi:hypothetical protein